MDPVLANADQQAAGEIWPAMLIALAGLGALAWRLPRLSGTTLVAPWGWSLIALVALAAVEIVIATATPPTPDWAAPLRFAAAVGTVCPAMALMGAKRPQNRGWQLIVFSLWAILSLPAIEWLLFGGPREIHPARSWFLAILVAATTVNGLGTRYWPSQLVFTAGQLTLVAPFLISTAPLPANIGPLAGTAALVLAWFLLAADVPRPKPAPAWDRIWLDFRDHLGTLWAARVMERFNASARMHDWPVSLTWQGFRSTDAHQPATLPPAAEVSFRALLRRFVSPAWIDRRVAHCDSPKSVNDSLAAGRP